MMKFFMWLTAAVVALVLLVALYILGIWPGGFGH